MGSVRGNRHCTEDGGDAWQLPGMGDGCDVGPWCPAGYGGESW